MPVRKRVREAMPGRHRTHAPWRIAEAFALAGRGEIAAGDALLHEGLRCSVTLFRSNSLRGIESVLLFHGALIRYARRFGVRIE